jgi:hypothetical protein
MPRRPASPPAFFYGEVNLKVAQCLFFLMTAFHVSLLADDDVYKPIDPGLHVLSVGREICFVEKEIIIGSCWDFVNAVYTRAGYVGQKRETIFKSAKTGPYAPVESLRPGDWLFFLNQEFGGIEHSAIFVGWVNKERRIAKTLDYVGGKRAKVGKYTAHELSFVYTVIRPKLIQQMEVK